MGRFLFLFIVFAAAAGYVLGRAKALRLSTQSGRLKSLPGYHGSYVAIATGLPLLALFLAWGPLSTQLIQYETLNALPSSLRPTDDLSRSAALRKITTVAENPAASSEAQPEIVEAANTLRDLTQKSVWLECGLALLLAAAALMWSLSRIRPDFHAQPKVEFAVSAALRLSAIVAILTTIGIVASVLFESLRFFEKYPILDFLFGTQWSPQIALRADQVGQSGAFGILPLLAGTMLIMLVAMCVAVPIGLFAAIYLSEYASARFRQIAKPILEILAGVPTVVFGFFAALTVAPLLRNSGAALGLDIASESALAAGLVMGIMIIPFVSSLSDDVISAVPQSLRDGAYAMGSTKSETIKQVVLTAALPGIVSAIMLAVSRAIGETMIVVMAAGLAGNLTFNPLDAVTTITVQIKTLLVGDQEFDSVKTLSAFALGLVLFVFTLFLNWTALRIVEKYREQYD